MYVSNPTYLVCRKADVSNPAYLVCRKADVSNPTYLVCRKADVSNPTYLVCRKAGYLKHALSLAEKHAKHDLYLKIQIDDQKDYQVRSELF